jgi:ABC-type Na+ efflux pump permease subunit
MRRVHAPNGREGGAAVIRDPLMPLIVLYAGVVTAVSLVLAVQATRLPYCHSVGAFLGAFGVLAAAGTWMGGRVVIALGDRRDRREQQ